MGHASGSEIFQFIVALMGLTIESWRMWVVVTHVVAITEAPREDYRRLIALIASRGQMVRVAAQGLLVVVGIVSLLLPPPSLSGDVLSEMQQAAIIRVLLIGLTVLLTLDAFAEEWQRSAFYKFVHDKTNNQQVRDVSILVDGKTAARGSMHVDPEPIIPPSSESGEIP